MSAAENNGVGVAQHEMQAFLFPQQVSVESTESRYRYPLVIPDVPLAPSWQYHGQGSLFMMW